MNETHEVVVQKFGGSVLSRKEDYLAAARAAAQSVRQGFRVAAVVSARRGGTDRLMRSALALHDAPPPAALDLLLATGELKSAALLALALDGLGVQAEALNPWQLGLRTDHRHGAARIIAVNPLPLLLRLAERAAVVVPGFIGRGPDDALTTLGRGGSDLTAIALAGALGARACEFFKDVPGYFSADPRQVPEAVHRPIVTGEEALALSRSGCRFLQDRAIAWSVRSACRVLLRSLDDPERATEIRRKAPPSHPAVIAITHQPLAGRPFPGVAPAAAGEAALLTLAGEGLRSDPRPERLARAALAGEGIPVLGGLRRRIRLTFALRGEDLIPAQLRLHRVLMEAEGRAGAAGEIRSIVTR